MTQYHGPAELNLQNYHINYRQTQDGSWTLPFNGNSTKILYNFHHKILSFSYVHTWFHIIVIPVDN